MIVPPRGAPSSAQLGGDGAPAHVRLGAAAGAIEPQTKEAWPQRPGDLTSDGADL